MTRRKFTVTVEADLVTAVKVAAARSHRHDYEVVEEALRRHLGLNDVVEQIWSGLGSAALSESEAIDIATHEVAAVRAHRRSGSH